jgi:glyoxylase I family protein
MVNVLGIGGIFFRAKDPASLAQWYETHFNINPAPSAPDMAPWITQTGVTIFSPFDEATDYFPTDRQFMLNFRIADLDAAIAELTAAGIACTDILVMESVGRFARVSDPEGNQIELWETAHP